MLEEKGFWDDIVPRVDSERCRRCADCPPMAACSANAFRRDRADSVPVVDDSFCFGCYSCAAECRYDAVILPRR